MKLTTLIHQDPLQRQRGNYLISKEDPWPLDLHFTDSPHAISDHGSKFRLPSPALASFCGSSSMLCTQHPMAGIAAINRNGT